MNDILWRPLQEQLASTELELPFWLDLVHRETRVKQTDIYSNQQARLSPGRAGADPDR